MLKIIKSFLFFLLFFSCSKNIESDTSTEIFNELGYILKNPKSSRGLVVLFPSFGNSILKSENETKIDDKCFLEGYASLFIDYKYDFFLDKSNFIKINHLINNVLDENNIYSENLFIGGFSVGGNVALSYCIWYNKLNKKINKPLGIFVGDSPVDLYSLYNSQVKVIEENISNDVALEEGKFIINYLEEQIGNPRNSMDKYYKLSPFVDKEINKSNIKYLKDYYIHFYSEPDLEWFKKIYGYEDYEDTNSFKIDRFKEELDKRTTKKIIYTKTKNKGYVDDIKNPHSWSIINHGE